MSTPSLLDALEPTTWEQMQCTCLPERLTCDLVGHHLPGCYNPHHDTTACICGQMWWRGRVGTWHTAYFSKAVGESHSGRPIYERGPWFHHFLHVCGRVDVHPEWDHVCGGAEAVTAEQMWACGGPIGEADQ